MLRIVTLVLAIGALTPCAARAELPFERPAEATRELEDGRTPTSRTWELRSGERVTQVTESPVQWQDADGDWHGYDPQFARAGDELVAQSGQTEIALPTELQAAQDTLDLTGPDGDRLRMRLIGARGDARRAGTGTVVYDDVLEGVDLRLHAVPEGVKEDILLGSAAASRDLVYRLRLDGGGALRGDGMGGLVLERDGAVIFEIPAPLLIDAAGATSSRARFQPLERGAGEWDVVIVLDDQWLDAVERVWPVNVDPTVNAFVDHASGPYDDCQRVDRDPMTYTIECTGWHRTVGGGWSLVTGGRPQASIGYLRFPTLTTFQNDAIESATLRLNRLASGTPNLTPLSIFPNRSAFLTPNPDYGIEAKIGPGAVGLVEADVTEAVVAWRDWTLSGGTRGMVNNGFLLGHVRDRRLLNIQCAYPYNLSCDWTRYTSTRNTASPSLHPVLEVRSWPAAPAGSAIVSPEEGELSGRFVELQARALHSSVTGVQFQYIAGNGRRWADIPTGALRSSDGRSVATNTVPVARGLSDLAVWDLAATPGGEIDGPVHVRAYLESPLLNQGGTTPSVSMRAERNGEFDAARARIGPGEVNLVSGDFSATAIDATHKAFLQDLSLRRDYSARGVSRRIADMFGPGWNASIDADGGDLPYRSIYKFSDIREEAEVRHEIRPADFDWERYNNQIFECWWMAEDEAAERACFAMKPTVSYVVENIPTIKRWEYRYAVVEFGDGSRAQFKQTVSPDQQVSGWEPDGPLAGYRIEHREEPASGISEFTLTEPGGGIARFRSEIRASPHYRILSYQQPGSTSASTYLYEPSRDRQRLKRVVAPYPTGGTPRWMELEWADIGGGIQRVVAVRAGSGTDVGSPVAQYAYSSSGRLVRAWDPRTPQLVTQYGYDNRGLLTVVRPPGEEEWRLTYGQVQGDAGYRVTSISRDHPSGSSATNTIRYNVPLAGADAPYEMGSSETARWGQVNDIPWQAVAIFPADDTPSATNVDYRNATIHYLDLEGRAVNVATPGGHITTTEYDANSNPIRQLTASNRARALAAGATSATVAYDLSTLHSYSGDGLDLQGTYQPTTSNIQLSSGTAVTGRRYTTTHYTDHLPTQKWRGVQLSPGNRVDERELVRYEYDGLGGMSGWRARYATKTIADPGGENLTTYSILHPSYPLVEESRRPRGAAGGSRPDVRFYQYADVAPSSRIPAALRTGSVCDSGTPSGFLCMDSEGTAPTASVPRRRYRYNTLGQTTDLWESTTLTRTGTPARHTATAYDTGGRISGMTVTGGQGEPVPATIIAYHAATGRQATVSASGRGTISTSYDSNGRLQQYTDASGLTTRYSHDLRGRISQTVEDGVRTVSYGYDERDDLTAVTDPDLLGPVTATYDPDGNAVTETLPSGLRATYTYDETGVPTSLTWEQTTGCASDCERARSVVEGRDADGRMVGHGGNGEDAAYTYDRVGRLVRVDTTAGTVCTRQQYVYDASFNRTRAETITSASAGTCGTGTASARTWTHDTADRVTSTGWTHDAFGRATSVPAPDSGGRGALAAGYYTDDLVRQLTLDGRSHTYNRDPARRTTTVTSSGGIQPAITTTNRYADTTDSPVVTTRSTGASTRNLTGPTGTLLAIKDGTRLTYQLTDLQGSVTATVPSTATDGRPTASTTYDPFGTITSTAPNVIDWTTGTAGYGWLGGHQRPTQFEQAQGAGPPMEMGVRVYLPASGRFLQRDPVDGGSANPYEYAMQDPLNVKDLDGRCTWGLWCPYEGWRKRVSKAFSKVKRGVEKGAKVSNSWVWNTINPFNPVSKLSQWVNDNATFLAMMTGCSANFWGGSRLRDISSDLCELGYELYAENYP